MTNCKQDFVSKKIYGSKALDIPYLSEYIKLVDENIYPFCNAQYQLVAKIKHDFSAEKIYVDVGQAERYFTYQKYFPYDLFPWEKFVFTLHNCTYTEDGLLRYPILVLYVGRGTGKNGYLSFENFCLLTPTNGVMNYDIDIFAMSEDQAKVSFNDVWNVLEDNKAKMSKFFSWTKEQITNLQTKSVFRFRTSSHKSADSRRPGKVDFDEYHAYEDSKLVDTSITGLGKKPLPRRTIISTNGYVRGGLLDQLTQKSHDILDGIKDDNGTLPFMCYIESEEEIENQEAWIKAIPSLPYLPELKREMITELSDYLENKIDNISFVIKRMNYIPTITEGGVALWEDIKATNQEIDEESIKGKYCVAGIDYMKTTDMLSALLLFDVDDKDVLIKHSWVCTKSADLPRIKAPLRAWEAAGLLTFVDAPEISPEIPCYWIANQLARLEAQLVKVGIDSYRYTLLSRALREILFASSEKGYENVLLIRPSNEMQAVPTITSQFVNHRIVAGDDPLFRWAANNTKLITSKAGNITYGKIEPKSRKTDPFKAYVAAKCASLSCAENLADSMQTYDDLPGVFVY